MRAQCCGGPSVFTKNHRKSFKKQTFVLGNSMGRPLVHGVGWMTRECFFNAKIYRKSLSSSSEPIQLQQGVYWKHEIDARSSYGSDMGSSHYDVLQNGRSYSSKCNIA